MGTPNHSYHIVVSSDVTLRISAPVSSRLCSHPPFEKAVPPPALPTSSSLILSLQAKMRATCVGLRCVSRAFGLDGGEELRPMCADTNERTRSFLDWVASVRSSKYDNTLAQKTTYRAIVAQPFILFAHPHPSSLSTPCNFTSSTLSCLNPI